MFSATLLAGKTAVLTASTSGIGLKTAEIMARSGAKAVLINGRNEAAGVKAAADIKSIAPDTDVHFVAADVTIPAEIEGLFRIAAEKLGGLDIFVHAMPGLAAFPAACRHALPLMKARGGGAIVAIAADAAKTIGLEEARGGIRVNVVTPSLVRGTREGEAIQMHPTARRVFAKAEQTARRGPTTAEDVAPVIVFLASPLAAHISGQIVRVHDGISFV
jgi:gluconate 5-dehydrogenase/3-oxoacyl-[acyl-carrier protein] reductase